MKIELSYSEINRIIEQKIDQPIRLSTGGTNVLRLTYEYSTKILFREVTKTIELNMMVESVNYDSVKLRINNFSPTLIKLISPVINNITKRNNVDFISVTDGLLHVKLYMVSALKSFFNAAKLTSLTFCYSNITVGIELKN